MRHSGGRPALRRSPTPVPASLIAHAQEGADGLGRSAENGS
jgi:hypothetical protein